MNLETNKKTQAVEDQGPVTGPREKRSRLGGIISWLLCLLLVPVILLNFVLIIRNYTDPDRIPGVFGYMPMIVLSGSMSPAFESGSVILIKAVENPSAMKKGDVVCYLLDGKAITHRIVDVEKDGKSVRYIVQGDANNVEDRLAVNPSQIQGEYTGIHIEGLGDICMFMQSTTGMIFFVVCPLVCLLLWDFVARKIKGRKEKSRAEELEEELRALKAENLRQSREAAAKQETLTAAAAPPGQELSTAAVPGREEPKASVPGKEKRKTFAADQEALKAAALGREEMSTAAIPGGEKLKAAAPGQEASTVVIPGQELSAAAAPGEEKTKASASGEELSAAAVSGKERRKALGAEKEKPKVLAANQEVLTAAAPGEEKPTPSAPGREEPKASAPGQELSTAAVPGREELSAAFAPGQEKPMASAPGKEKRKAFGAGKKKRKAAAADQEAQKAAAPGQELSTSSAPGQPKPAPSASGQKPLAAGAEGAEPRGGEAPKSLLDLISQEQYRKMSRILSKEELARLEQLIQEGRLEMAERLILSRVKTGAKGSVKAPSGGGTAEQKVKAAIRAVIEEPAHPAVPPSDIAALQGLLKQAREMQAALMNADARPPVSKTEAVSASPAAPLKEPEEDEIQLLTRQLQMETDRLERLLKEQNQ